LRPDVHLGHDGKPNALDDVHLRTVIGSGLVSDSEASIPKLLLAQSKTPRVISELDGDVVFGSPDGREVTVIQ